MLSFSVQGVTFSIHYTFLNVPSFESVFDSSHRSIGNMLCFSTSERMLKVTLSTISLKNKILLTIYHPLSNKKVVL